MRKKIPLAKPYLGKEEERAVLKVVRSGLLSMGGKLEEFEKKFAGFLGVKYAVAVNSGTSGLYLCVKALGIGPGDEVVTAPFSFVASSNPVVEQGAKPVFADIERRTYNIDPEKLKAAISAKTRAIILVHIFGLPCDMGSVMEIAEKNNIPVIEDACEAPGATYKGKMIGSFGKLSVFGFYPNKQITTGEGGLIATDDLKLANILRSLRNQGRDDSGEWLNHVRIGYNLRLDELSCALGVEQLKKIRFILRAREELAGRFNAAFSKIDGLVIPFTPDTSRRSWWVYYLRVTSGINRNKVLEYLNSHSVSARAYFDPPIHLQPVYKEMFGFKPGAFPAAEEVAQSGFIIPFFIQMSDAQVKYVIRTVIEAVRRAKI